MANNPYVNKVQFGDETLIDLTSDTATPDKVIQGMTFHDKSGALQTGTLERAEPLTTEHLNALRAIIQG